MVMEDNYDPILDPYIEDLDNKYTEFLGNAERSFPKLELSGTSMMARLYCGLRFTEGSIRALKIFKMFNGKDLLDEIGKQYMIDWLQSMIEDLKEE
jgi:hypothetical protein